MILILQSHKALIGFAGRRVIEQTVREKLPDDFQTAEFLLEHGQLDAIFHRKEMREKIATIVKLHRKGGVSQCLKQWHLKNLLSNYVKKLMS